MHITEEKLATMSEEEIQDLLENIEQLDELSRKTLASYVDKAYRDSHRRQETVKDLDNHMQKLGDIEYNTGPHLSADDKRGLWDARQKMSRTRTKQNDKALDREMIAKRALRKLAKESADEDLSEEEFVNGGSKTPDPANTGDVHANRPQDRKATADMTRADYYQQVMGHLSNMPTEVLAQICKGLENEVETVDYSAQNRASITTKEDVEDLFQGQELSEEFREKAGSIFEAAVVLRVSAEKERLEEAYELALQEQIDEMEDAVNQYLTSVVEEWVEENKLVIEQSLEHEMNANLVDDIRAVLESYNIDVSEETLSVAEELEEEVEELTERLNSQKLATLQLKEELREAHKALIVEDLVRGLPLTKQEKFKDLCEDVDVSDVGTFEATVRSLFEQFTKTKLETAPIIEEKEIEIVETLNEDKTVEVEVDSTISRYVAAGKKLKNQY